MPALYRPARRCGIASCAPRARGPERRPEAAVHVKNDHVPEFDQFEALLGEALPGWREHRQFPFVFAAMEQTDREAGSSAAALALELALGVYLDSSVSLEDALSHRLERSAAGAAVERLFRQTLAYDAPWVDPAFARRLAEAFLQPFDSDAVFLSNGELLLGGSSPRGWNPLTTATFDAGVVAVGRDLYGAVWVTDED